MAMPRFARASCFALVLVAGCTVDPPAPPARGTVVAQISAHASPRNRKLSFLPAAGSPHLGTASIDSLPIVQDDTAGSGPASTVELVTNSVGDTLAGDTCPGVAPGQGAFCANVTLNQFYPRPLNHVFVQITSITNTNFQPFSVKHQGLDDDGSELGLDSSLGLWKYTAPNSTTPGVLGVAPDNSGTRDWVFANPDDADTLIGLQVIGTLTYSSYTRTASSLPFVDACASGTNIGTPTATQITLPFPFTLYDTTSSTVTVNRRGVLVIGASNLIAPATTVALPSSGNVPKCNLFKQCSVPRPAIFPFWDGLIYMANGAVCTQASGTAPNRTFAITWEHLERNAVNDIGSDYTFTAVLHEGTDVIDLLYGSMLGPAPNASGGAATVGVQNAAGTVATSETNTTHYGTGASWTLTPVP
jgi:hypothetical protein